ncbi:DUF4174 domain-containing protein [Paracoccus sp. (in: a-proteobacteria)]|uniref:DUF4174 domain-containing protein n=1 Tax=Paracoccus sp. TaxID=267 RepID=UPI00289E92EF|nr:DUF4174 domain-containing protein [Paracoccus sp. (in: a-proteobacteria)]
MKFSRLILFCAVPLGAAMGDRPANDGRGTGFVRTTIGEDSASDPVDAPLSAGEIEILDASEVEPGAYLWKARPVVVFADSQQDPAFIDQLKMLTRDPAPLLTRDVVVIADADPAANSAWRRSLRPEGFSLVLVDKDGQVKQRKPAPWSVREITRAIDKTPLRRQEIGGAALVP